MKVLICDDDISTVDVILNHIKKSFFDAVRGGACFHARHGFKV